MQRQIICRSVLGNKKLSGRSQGRLLRQSSRRHCSRQEGGGSGRHILYNDPTGGWAAQQRHCIACRCRREASLMR